MPSYLIVITIINYFINKHIESRRPMYDIDRGYHKYYLATCYKTNMRATKALILSKTARISKRSRNHAQEALADTRFELMPDITLTQAAKVLPVHSSSDGSHKGPIAVRRHGGLRLDSLCAVKTHTQGIVHPFDPSLHHAIPLPK